MATQGFNFDFSSLQPLLGRALQAWDWKLGRLPVEAGQADTAYKDWLVNQKHKRGMDMMNVLENYRQARAREDLAGRAQTEAERGAEHERGAEAAFVEGEQTRMADLQRKYGFGPAPDPRIQGASARLAWRGRLGGTSYGGSSGDDALGNTGLKAMESINWHKQICRVNPNAPGCPGTWG